MTSNRKLHPDREVLELYSLGHLSGCELDSVEDHLLVCQLCQDQLALIDSYIADVKEGCRIVSGKPEPKRIRWRDRLFTLPRPVMAGAFVAFLLALLLPLGHHSAEVGTPVAVRLETYRGTEPAGAAQAEAKRPLHLILSLSSTSPKGSYRVDIVNGNGSLVWTGAASLDRAGLSIDPGASFGPGLYWVRLYDAGNMLVREYSLRLK